MLFLKHRVYEGVLHGLSGGHMIQGSSGGVTATVTTTAWATHVNVGERRRRARQEGWLRREFIVVGDTRIRNVAIWPYDDELLQEALGRKVAISVVGPKPESSKRHLIAAVRTPAAGVERLSRKLLLGGAIVKVLKYLFVAPLLALALLIPVGIVGRFVSETAAYALLPVAGLVVLVWFCAGLYNIRVMFKASAALGPRIEGRGAHVPV